MILEQFYLRCLAHASYLIGDSNSGIAIIVDPQRDVDLYVEVEPDLAAKADPREQALTATYQFLLDAADVLAAAGSAVTEGSS